MKNIQAASAFVILLLTICSVAESKEIRDPEELFNSFCFSCHGTGWEDAPVVGDSYVWEERVEQGIDVLLSHTIKGINSMPPKGSCADCTSEELKAIILWMSE